MRLPPRTTPPLKNPLSLSLFALFALSALSAEVALFAAAAAL
jgi:hypothetical protein